MKTIIYILLIIAIGYNTTAQITLIPDPHFEQFLINKGIDSDGIINGQILTADALAVTKLDIKTPYGNDYDEFIHDVTGLEAFINLDSLSINRTMLGDEMSENTVNLSTLVNLKYFETSTSMLTFIDFSHNKILETIKLYNGGDVIPMNYVDKIDLTNNPNVHTLIIYYAKEINLRNNNNNENMYLDVSCMLCDDIEDTINVCIEVDNAQAALNNEYPYSQWIVHKSYANVSFTDNIVDCVLNKPTFSQLNIKIHPNPVSDILYFDTDQEINKVILFDMLGRKIIEQNNVNSVSVSDLEKGSYILKLFSDKGVHTEKIVVE